MSEHTDTREIKYNEPATGETELKLRCDAAECKFYFLAKNLMNMKINLKTRTNILPSLVRSRIVYACQTWNVTQTQLQPLNAMYMSCIRKMTKGGYIRGKPTHGALFTQTMIYQRCQKRQPWRHLCTTSNTSISPNSKERQIV